MTDRRLPIGAELGPGDGTHFRVWAPKRRRVEVVVEPAPAPTGIPASAGAGDRVASSSALRPEEGGHFSGLVPGVGAGARYRFRLDGEAAAYPDPASRWQPEGPHGPSCVVDPARYRWGDAGWGGATEEPVIYELHAGTFTPEGTWAAAREKLPHLAELGVTVLEVMPVADFPGRFGWGYDGVAPFAPYHGYGDPDELRRFVDVAHQAGLAVILDVVYNHLGPDGNPLGAFSDDYESRTHTTEWGASFNFDGPGSGPVRELCLANVRYWIDEFHVDGFRFDATQDLKDDGPDHILAALAREAREAARERPILLVAENEPQDSRIVRAPEEGGRGLDLIVNEDFHHSAVVALTGYREGYYSQHHGSAQELVSAVTRGFLYQGQHYPWQGAPRGTSTRGLPLRALVHCLENHDQVANVGPGLRLHQMAAPGRWRAMVALMLLGPATPLLFQGQEFASSAPFLYFADQEPELAELTWKGRMDFLAQFRNLQSQEMRPALPAPSDPDTFRRCRLDWGERERNAWAVTLHRDLLRLRREDAPLSSHGREVDGAVLGSRAFVLRGIGAAIDGSRDRLLLVNLGADLSLALAPEPLLAPPPLRTWKVVWSSESPEYGGRGAPELDPGAWILPGGCAQLLAPAGAPPARSGGTDGEN
jgi:maltooligosyltrehalose trehalohydrolase